MITVEKGIPVPAKAAQTIYPFAQMQVGDSFFVSGMKSATFGGYCNRATRRLGHRYTVRTVTEHDVRGIRVWRVE